MRGKYFRRNGRPDAAHVRLGASGLSGAFGIRA